MALTFQPLFGSRDRRLNLRLDAGGRVAKADGGGLALLGVLAVDLVGRAFIDLVCEPDRGLVEQLLRIVGAGGQANRQLVRLEAGGEPEPFLFDGRRPRQGEGLILEMDSPPPEERDAMGAPLEALGNPFDDRDGFPLAVGDLFGEGDAFYALTLLDVPALVDSELRVRYGTDRVDSLRRTTESTLRAYAEGTRPGRLSDQRYGLLHDGAVDAAEITGRIAQAAGDGGIDRSDLGIGAVCVDMSGGPSSRAAVAMAVDHVVTRFVEDGPAAAAPATLTAAHQAALEDAVRRIALLREALQSDAVSLRLRPVVDLRTAHPAQYQARLLVAMDGHYVEPSGLIRMAADPDLVAAADRALMRRSMRFLGEAAADPSIGVDRLVVAMSAESLAASGFCDEALADLWRDFPVAARHLGLLLADFDAASAGRNFEAELDRLRDQGHPIGIDNLAPALIPLSAIETFGITMVRLGGRYSRTLIRPGEAGRLMRELLSVWTRLGVDVMADGIGGEGMAKQMRACNVRYGCGPHFGGWTAPPEGAEAAA